MNNFERQDTQNITEPLHLTEVLGQYQDITIYRTYCMSELNSFNFFIFPVK